MKLCHVSSSLSSPQIYPKSFSVGCQPPVRLRTSYIDCRDHGSRLLRHDTVVSSTSILSSIAFSSPYYARITHVPFIRATFQQLLRSHPFRNDTSYHIGTPASETCCFRERFWISSCERSTRYLQDRRIERHFCLGIDSVRDCWYFWIGELKIFDAQAIY